ncbi:MAG: acyloxyacyl hydrolase [Chitinophaga sp.]|uniref:acyloxyacyl hydrolase n=1 Tax=Chitinophaga sp. TaxID=1869181 RepID=UPI001B08F98F|nr:acyloxyacyl hydrolase [Chitinophaga sp.]MBO9727618.1 acyloxyacyl hydrolase [Chitinophaga sp.]
MKPYALFLLLLFFGRCLPAQDTTDLWKRARLNPNLGQHKYLELKFHSGSHLYNGEELKIALDDGYRSVELRMGWQSSGNKTWQRVFNYPSYGLGFYTGDIGNPTILGNPSGIYGFFFVPFHRRKINDFELGLSLGLTYDLNPYDSSKNPLNDAIGSKVDVYFNLSASGVLKVSDAIDFLYGADITHFSNGRTHTPNLGLNMAGLHVGIRYHYNIIRGIVIQQIDPTYKAPRRPTFVKQPVPPPRLYNEVSATAAFGVVQTPSDEHLQAFYGTASLIFDYNRRISHMSSIGGGLDGFYDGSLGWTYHKLYTNVSTTDKMLMGYHAGYTLHVKDFEMKAQLGSYAWKRNNEKGNYFMRIALRYNIGRYGFIQVALKTMDGGAADWIEWGGGGKMRW